MLFPSVPVCEAQGPPSLRSPQKPSSPGLPCSPAFLQSPRSVQVLLGPPCWVASPQEPVPQGCPRGRHTGHTVGGGVSSCWGHPMLSLHVPVCRDRQLSLVPLCSTSALPRPGAAHTLHTGTLSAAGGPQVTGKERGLTEAQWPEPGHQLSRPERDTGGNCTRKAWPGAGWSGPPWTLPASGGPAPRASAHSRPCSCLGRHVPA